MAKVLRLSNLRKKLQALPAAAKASIRRELEKAAEIICASARALVEVDEGHLKDSIGWTWGKAPKGSMVLGKAAAGLDSDLVITIYAGNEEAFYARWVEFGTKGHEQGGKFAGTDHPGTSAHPFFFPAYRANKKLVTRGIRKGTREAARAVAASS